MLKKVGLGLLVVFIVCQFFTIDKSVPEHTKEEDFFTHHVATEELQILIESACYDCHSYKTEYPFCSNIAPISWWLAEHIEDGRKHLNFSKWTTYSDKKADHKLEECVEELEKGEMPLEEYTYTHAEAKLNEEQRELLMIWFKAQRQQYKVN